MKPILFFKTTLNLATHKYHHKEASLFFPPNRILDDKKMTSMTEAQQIFTDRVHASLDAGETTFNYNHDYDITAIPSSVKALRPVVQILHIDNNFRLTEIHPGVGDLNQLRWLNCSYNQLETVPPEIARLGRLERLYLNNNQLTHLPLEFWALKNLEEVRVDNNNIRALPTYFLFLPKLREVLLENNPLLTPAEADGAEAAMLFPPMRTGDCGSCSIRFTNSICFVTFHKCCGHENVPIVHYVCSERCKEQLEGRLKQYDTDLKAAEELAKSPLRSRN